MRSRRLPASITALEGLFAVAVALSLAACEPVVRGGGSAGDGTGGAGDGTGGTGGGGTTSSVPVLEHASACSETIAQLCGELAFAVCPPTWAAAQVPASWCVNGSSVSANVETCTGGSVAWWLNVDVGARMFYDAEGTLVRVEENNYDGHTICGGAPWYGTDCPAMGTPLPSATCP
jgi:hypothetical protein